MNTQDFTKGVDFTGINPATASDHNNLIELAVPTADTSASVGKGMLLVTTDTALDTPDVPDASATTKWKRYLWIRRPFAGATITQSQVYIWNDDADNDATYLKWEVAYFDTTAIIAIANNALATANNAVTIARVANDTSNTAETKSDSAVASAAAANVAAAAAQASATAANAAAAAAQVVADGAAAQATAATAAATAAKNLTGANPGSYGYQQLRTNAAANAVEWFSVKDTLAILEERQAKGTPAGGSSIGANIRGLNTEVSNTGALVSLNVVTGVFTILKAGTYRVEAFATCYADGSHQHQLYLSVGGVLSLVGESVYDNSGTMNSFSRIHGVITIAAGTECFLSHYSSNSKGTSGLGRATNLSQHELYSGVILQLIGV